MLHQQAHVRLGGHIILRSGVSRPLVLPRTRVSICSALRDQSGLRCNEVPLISSDVQPNEHVALRALKVAALVPLLLGVMWAEPAHAARKSRQAAASQVVAVTEETKSPLEQLQATWQNLLQHLTHHGNKAAAQGSEVLASTAATLSPIASEVQGHATTLKAQAAAELAKPAVRKALAITVALLVLGLVFKGTSSSSTSAAAPAASTSGTSGTSTTASAAAGVAAAVAAAKPAPAAPAAAAKPPTPAVAPAPAKPPAAPAAAASSGSNGRATPSSSAAAAAAASTVEKQLQAVQAAAERVSIAAAATAADTSGKIKAAAAAVEKAAAQAEKAKSNLAASSQSVAPPSVVKPSFAEPKAAAPPAPAAAPTDGSSRPSKPPSPVPSLPKKGAATPALAVLGAGAVLFDLMVPLGRLAVASVASAAKGGSASSSSASSSSSSGAAGGGSGSESKAAAKPGAPAAAAPAPDTSAPVVKPKTQSRFAKAVAAAAESAQLPRGVPTELPPITLKELEEALNKNK